MQLKAISMQEQSNGGTPAGALLSGSGLGGPVGGADIPGGTEGGPAGGGGG